MRVTPVLLVLGVSCGSRNEMPATNRGASGPVTPIRILAVKGEPQLALPEEGIVHLVTMRPSREALRDAWPDHANWYSMGLMGITASPRPLLVELREPRIRKTWASHRIEIGPEGFALAFAFRFEPKAEFKLFSARDGALREVLSGPIPPECVPKSDWLERADYFRLRYEDGWDGMTGQSWLRETGEPQIQRAWSWNGKHTEDIAEVRDRWVNPKVQRTYTIAGVEADSSLLDKPLPEWPQPVWFLVLTVLPDERR